MGNSFGRFRVNEPQVTAKVMDGEAVIIHLGSGIYYSMEGIGCLAWEQLAAGRDASAVVDGIAGRYGLGRDLVAADIRRLLDELVGQDLLVESEAPSPTEAGPTSEPPASYDSPTLNRFEDMAELLALDPPLPAAPR